MAQPPKATILDHFADLDDPLPGLSAIRCRPHLAALKCQHYLETAGSVLADSDDKTNLFPIRNDDRNANVVIVPSSEFVQHAVEGCGIKGTCFSDSNRSSCHTLATTNYVIEPVRGGG